MNEIHTAFDTGVTILENSRGASGQWDLEEEVMSLTGPSPRIAGAD